jgi:hypothetical protein
MASKFTQQLNVAVTFGETQQLRRIPAAHLDPKFNVGIFFCFLGAAAEISVEKERTTMDPFLAGKNGETLVCGKNGNFRQFTKLAKKMKTIVAAKPFKSGVTDRPAILRESGDRCYDF